MENLLNEATGIAILLTPIITALVQLVKSADINTRWLPFVSVGIGTVAGAVFGYAGHADLFTYTLAGLVSGLAASGFYDGIQSARGE